MSSSGASFVTIVAALSDDHHMPESAATAPATQMPTPSLRSARCMTAMPAPSQSAPIPRAAVMKSQPVAASSARAAIPVKK